MRVRVAYTIEIDDDGRELLRAYYGQEGKATREEIQTFYRQQGQENGNMILADHAFHLDEQAKRNTQ